MSLVEIVMAIVLGGILFRALTALALP